MMRQRRHVGRRFSFLRFYSYFIKFLAFLLDLAGNKPYNKERNKLTDWSDGLLGFYDKGMELSL